MFYKIAFLLVPVIFLSVAFARAQEENQERVVISVAESRTKLNVFLNTNKALTGEQREILNDKSNYVLYRIDAPDDPEKMRGVKIVDCGKNTDGQKTYECWQSISAAGNSYEFSLTLPDQRVFEYKTYMLKIKGLKLTDDEQMSAPFSFNLKQKARILPSIDAARNKILIKSAVSIEKSGEPLKVSDEVLEISPKHDELIRKENAGVIAARLNEKSPETDRELILEKKLSEGRTHYLAVTQGLSDGSGEKITAAGKITVLGLPPPQENPKFDIRLSSAAAAGSQKPSFDLATNVNVKNFDRLFFGGWLLEPGVSAEVGLGQTKSKNSIVADFPFRRPLQFYHCRSAEERRNQGNPPELRAAEDRPQTVQTAPPCDKIQRIGLSDSDKERQVVAKLSNYNRWTSRPFGLDSIDFMVGPKFELYRGARANALGTLRLNFNFNQWDKTIATKRDHLRTDLGNYGLIAERVAVRSGFRLVPTVAVDFGSNLTSEVVENQRKKIRVILPSHPIFRTSAGFAGFYQRYFYSLPVTFGVEASLAYLGFEEAVGNKTDNGIDIRRIRGFQPHAKASFDIALDAAKRYSFSFTYENGRSAPDFQYFNKLSAGIHLIY